jgi:hypothetical protein
LKPPVFSGLISHQVTAFRWWNNLSQTGARGDQRPMILPTPVQLICALIDISPPLVLLYDSTDSDERFWPRIELAISVFTQSSSVPSLRARIPEFVTFLFDHRLDFHFTDIKSYMTLFQIRNKRFDAIFVLWQLPEVISNPRFFLDLLSHLKHIGDDSYQQFLNAPGSVDLILDRYVGLIGATTPIYLIEFILALFVEKIGKICDPTVASTVLWERFLVILGAPDLTLSVEAFRAMMLIFNLSRFLFPPEHHLAWLMDLLKATFDIRHLHLICVNFCLELDFPGFKIMSLCRLLMNRDSSNGSDLRLLSKLVTRVGIPHPLRIIRFLLEKATRNSFLGPTIAVSVAPIIQCYWETANSFREWIDLYIRNCFEFVGISWAISKYNNRRATILLFFEAIYRFELPCLTRMIVRYYSTLVNSAIVPEWSIDIQMGCDWDVDLEKETRSRMSKGFDVKHMLDSLPLPEDAKPKQRVARPRPSINVRKPVIASPHMPRTRNASLGPAPVPGKITAARSISLRPRMIVK